MRRCMLASTGGEYLVVVVLRNFYSNAFNNRVLRLPAIVYGTRRFDPETRAFFGYTSKRVERRVQ